MRTNELDIIESLGSSRRVLTVVRTALSETALRSLARQHTIDVPGFRTANAPPGLLARAIAAAAETSQPLRAELNRRLETLVSRAGRVLAGMPDTVAVEEFRHVREHTRERAIALVLAGLLDSRSAVASKANDTLNALDSGRLRLGAPAPGGMRSERAPSRSADARPRNTDPRPRTTGSRTPVEPRMRSAESRTRGPERRPVPPGPSADLLERTLAEREQQLRDLRLECTRQEQKIQKLRSQLDAEREAHERSKRNLEETRVALGRFEDPKTVLALADTSGEVDQLRALQLTTKLKLDTALRDCELLANGARVLESMIESLVRRSRDQDAPEPQRPARTSTAPAEAKLRLPIEGDHWPRHLQGFLFRLAKSEFVEAIQILDYSDARPTKLLLQIPDSALLAQYSDGERGARFLIVTTASSPASLHWVRRHLAETYFPST